MKNINIILLCLVQASALLFGITLEDLPKAQQLLIYQKTADVIKNRLELIELCKNVENLSGYISFLQGDYAKTDAMVSVPDTMEYTLVQSARSQIDPYLRERFDNPELDTDLVLILDGLLTLAIEASHRNASSETKERFERWLWLAIRIGSRIMEGTEWARFLHKWASEVRSEEAIIFESIDFLMENLLQSNKVLTVPGLPERIEKFGSIYPGAFEQKPTAKEIAKKEYLTEETRIAAELKRPQEEQERKQREEAERLWKEQEAKAAKAQEQERIAHEKAEAEKKAAEEAARKAKEEAVAKAAELKRQQEAEAAAKAKAEQERIAKEKAEAEKQRLAEEARKAAELKRQQEAEAAAKAKAEQERIAKEKAEAETKAKAEAETKAAEEAARKAKEEAAKPKVKPEPIIVTAEDIISAAKKLHPNTPIKVKNVIGEVSDKKGSITRSALKRKPSLEAFDFVYTEKSKK